MFRFILIVIYILFKYTNIANSQPISNFKKPNTMPKYFAIDIDDTFYIEDSDMMKKNIEAFKSLQNKNIKPFFCTGRNYGFHEELFGSDFSTDTNYNGNPGIYSNGAVVYDSDGKVLHIEKFTTEFLDKFKEFIENNNLLSKVVFHINDGVISLEDVDQDAGKFLNEKKIKNLGKMDYSDLKNKDVFSITMFDYSFDNCDFKKDVYHVKYSKYQTMQLSPLGCNKKVGLEKLLKHLNSNGNECAYIGDSNNDIEALQYCSTSFAVGNAKDEVKQNAKWVLDLNYDQGAFAKVVELMVQ